tara:strand:+ start:17537 stop:18208 length:672 start_codon:yes stop_codon:yes gene_type:complete
MELSYWLSRWNKGNTGFHMENGYPGLSIHWPSLPIRQNPVVLIPLAGKSVDIQWIADRARKVICVEISDVAIKQFYNQHEMEYTTTRFASFDIYHSQNIEFWCGDFMKLPQKKMGDVDLIYDKASIVALPKNMRQSYSNKIISLSSAYTKILMHLLSYNQSEMNGPPFSVDPDEIKQMFSEIFDIQILQKNSLKIQNFEKFLNRGLKSDLIEYLLLLSGRKPI